MKSNFHHSKILQNGFDAQLKLNKSRSEWILLHAHDLNCKRFYHSSSQRGCQTSRNINYKMVKVLMALAPGLAAAMYGSNSAVQMLSKSDLAKIKDSDEPWMVEFFASWCGHCKQLAPEYEKAAKALKGIVNLGAVDDQEAMGDFGVEGFPSIKFMGDSMTDYSGPRTADGIVDYILKQVFLSFHFHFGSFSLRFVSCAFSVAAVAKPWAERLLNREICTSTHSAPRPATMQEMQRLRRLQTFPCAGGNETGTSGRTNQSSTPAPRCSLRTQR